jgi:diguanylate cyclase (GGDEF)-like protein
MRGSIEPAMPRSGENAEVPGGAGRFGFSHLRYRLLLLVLLAVLPALTLIVSTAWEQRRLAARGAQEDALRLARLASTNQERLIEGTRPLLVVLAQHADVQGGNARVCNALFAEILRRFPLYTNLGAVRPDGDVFCSARSLPGPMNVAGRGDFQRTLAARDFTVSGYLTGPVVGKPLLVLSYPAIDDDGSLRAVVFITLDLSWAGPFFEKARLPQGATLTVTGHGGLVLARYPDPEAWTGKAFPEAPLVKVMQNHPGDGAAEVEGLDGIPRLFAFTTLAGPPASDRVYVSVGIPPAAAFAEGERLLARNLAWAGLAFLLVVMLAVVVGDLVILRRMNTVVRAAKRLSAGDLGARAEVTSADEIGVMARTFNAMADRLAQMINSEQRANEALAERVGELDLLNRLGDLLQVCLTLEEAYGVIGRLAQQFFPGDSGVLYAYSASRDVIEAVVSWGTEPGASDIVFPPDRCWALRSGRTHVVPETREGLLCTHLPEPAPRAYLCTPLVAQGEALGVLSLSSQAIGETRSVAGAEAKQRLAEAVAAQLALGLANIKLREILRSQSIRDSLTGLFNRRYMEETLEREVRRARRSGRPMGVLMLDLDRFKQVNDASGHEAGDAFLRQLGDLLQRGLRREDIVCRHGGEEFVVVLPDAPLEDARRRAEQLREAIRMLRVSYKGGIIGPLSASIGVAAFPGHGSLSTGPRTPAGTASGEALLRAADSVAVAAAATEDSISDAEH